MPTTLVVSAEYKDKFTRLCIHGRSFELATRIDQIQHDTHPFNSFRGFDYLAEVSGKVGAPFEVQPLGFRKYKLVTQQSCYWGNGLPASPCYIRVWVKVANWHPDLHWLLNPIDRTSIEYWLLVANRFRLEQSLTWMIADWIYKDRCHIKLNYWM